MEHKINKIFIRVTVDKNKGNCINPGLQNFKIINSLFSSLADAQNYFAVFYLAYLQQ